MFCLAARDGSVLWKQDSVVDRWHVETTSLGKDFFTVNNKYQGSAGCWNLSDGTIVGSYERPIQLWGPHTVAEPLSWRPAGSRCRPRWKASLRWTVKPAPCAGKAPGSLRGLARTRSLPTAASSTVRKLTERCTASNRARMDRDPAFTMRAAFHCCPVLLIDRRCRCRWGEFHIPPSNRRSDSPRHAARWRSRIATHR